jgi:dihydroflavonol-4-reductase
MKVLVTGATGFVGNNVTRALLAQGCDVRVLVRSPKDKSLAGLEVTPITGDLRDASILLDACDDVDRVIHVAAKVHIGWSQLAEHREINVEGTRNVATAAREHDARMVYVSSVDALGIGAADRPADEESPRAGKTPCSYVISKTEAEVVLRELIDDGLQATIVNPGFMLGPWDWKPSSGRMLLEVASRHTPLAPTGGMTLCHIADVTRGILAAMEKGVVGRNYILGGHTITYFDAWCLFAEISGGKPPKKLMGPWIQAIAGGVGDLLAKITRRESDINSAAIKMSSLFHYYSSARAEAELDYTISPLRSSVADAWSWFTENGYTK